MQSSLARPVGRHDKEHYRPERMSNTLGSSGSATACTYESVPGAVLGTA